MNKKYWKLITATAMLLLSTGVSATLIQVDNGHGTGNFDVTVPGDGASIPAYAGANSGGLFDITMPDGQTFAAWCVDPAQTLWNGIHEFTQIDLFSYLGSDRFAIVENYLPFIGFSDINISQALAWELVNEMSGLGFDNGHVQIYGAGITPIADLGSTYSPNPVDMEWFILENDSRQTLLYGQMAVVPAPGGFILMLTGIVLLFAFDSALKRRVLVNNGIFQSKLTT